MMKITQTLTISTDQVLHLLHQAGGQAWSISYLPKKHQLLIEHKKDWIAKLFLPWTHTWYSEGRVGPVEESHYCLALISAGQAALGYYHQGRLVEHKIFRAYLVRQKQGKSQYKHLKTKGKSRAGSRIRLEETEQFFKEINQRLQRYASQYPLDFWGLGCRKTLWPLLFDAALPPPFSSKSAALIELPYSFSKASFEELQILEYRLTQFHLLRSPLGESLIQLQQASTSDTDDSW